MYFFSILHKLVYPILSTTIIASEKEHTTALERTHALEYLPMIRDLPMDLRPPRAHALRRP